MNRLLTDNVWSQIKSATPKSGHKVAALAYVSTGGYCSFGKGDVLVCDATDRAIKSGETSAGVLKKFYDAGAEIYSCENLHAKAFVCGQTVLVGSCNLSESSANILRELAILTTNSSIRSQVLAFIHKLTRNAVPVDERFIQRIAKIPVAKRMGFGKARRERFKFGKRTWIIKTYELDPAKYKHEEPFVNRAESEIRRKLHNSKADISWIRWAGKSRFRSLAREGDTIIHAGPDLMPDEATLGRRENFLPIHSCVLKLHVNVDKPSHLPPAATFPNNLCNPSWTMME